MMRFIRKSKCKFIVGAVLISCIGSIAAVSGAQDVSTDTAEITAESGTSVEVYTTVRKTGQYPERFVVTYPEGMEAESLSAEDFHFEGQASKWGDSSLHELTCEFADLQEDRNDLTLIPDQFPEKFFYVEEWQVSCSSDPAFSFDSTMITGLYTETADRFETFEDIERGYIWHRFTPDSGEPCPVVVVFHGYGDTSNLLTYRTSVAWAEESWQADHPCFVISPVIDDASYFRPERRYEIFEGVHDEIGKLIEEGKADADRIYVMGNSFGGMSSLEYAEKYPDETAAVLALCPAVSFSAAAIKHLPLIKDIPVWFAHAEHDRTISVNDSKNAYNHLIEAGSTKARITVYTDEEMEACGAELSSESTYSFHHVELAVMEDPEYMEWMFEQLQNG